MPTTKDCDYCEAVLMPHGRQLCKRCLVHDEIDVCAMDLVELIDNELAAEAMPQPFMQWRDKQ